MPCMRRVCAGLRKTSEKGARGLETSGPEPDWALSWVTSISSASSRVPDARWMPNVSCRWLSNVAIVNVSSMGLVLQAVMRVREYDRENPASPQGHTQEHVVFV